MTKTYAFPGSLRKDSGDKVRSRRLKEVAVATIQADSGSARMPPVSGEKGSGSGSGSEMEPTALTEIWTWGVGEQKGLAQLQGSEPEGKKRPAVSWGAAWGGAGVGLDGARSDGRDEGRDAVRWPRSVGRGGGGPAWGLGPGAMLQVCSGCGGRPRLASPCAQPYEASASRRPLEGGGRPVSALGPLRPSQGARGGIEETGNPVSLHFAGQAGGTSSAQAVEVGEPPGMGDSMGGSGARAFHNPFELQGTWSWLSGDRGSRRISGPAGGPRLPVREPSSWWRASRAGDRTERPNHRHMQQR